MNQMFAERSPFFIIIKKEILIKIIIFKTTKFYQTFYNFVKTMSKIAANIHPDDENYFAQPLMSCKQVQRILKNVVQNKEKNDVCFSLIRRVADISVFNNEEMKPQQIAWKKLRKEGKLVIQPCNNIAKIIGGKTFYILVVQPTDETGEITNAGIDPLGIGFDEGAYLVSGYIYIFKKEINRDSVYKFVMGV